MVFLVIVICLLSERLLPHRSVLNRFNWFLPYAKGVVARIKTPVLSIRLALIVLPLLISLWLLLQIFDNFLFGLVAFVLNVAILNYCIGPENPFYAASKAATIILVNDDTDITAGDRGLSQYLTQVHEQLFAVLFWYIVFGPVGALFYRLMSLSRHIDVLNPLAVRIFDWMDWLPARITAMLYLLVGNFQKGFCYFSEHAFSAPAHNQGLLGHCALLALGTPKVRKKMTILDAERMVEHAVIVLLVFMALSTLLVWV